MVLGFRQCHAAGRGFMICLSCDKPIDWRKPIVYLGFDRAIHLDEFVDYIQEHPLLEWELTRKRERLVMEGKL